ncbi:hypothetical protein F442_15209 [Phytophthora nicotianae P10297]|uniref:Uncharacterized protein n=2 Tax=Phytophthora nicotianae TaxID=4792 RepID=W2R117_PHYN3|nr:hypothetical protein PPTG_21400 [Phytophthora nicotianae INRA-310]ETN19043.1 hypothetical protein PPTG_21400 [Phytophthora nicotianae INRA-310]ETP36932.1 hypothetical protein F442_15209 [Phytophthora nicotianae P10297]
MVILRSGVATVEAGSKDNPQAWLVKSSVHTVWTDSERHTML